MTRVDIDGKYCDSSFGFEVAVVVISTHTRPKCFLLYVNDLEAIVPLYKYVDDSSLFEICNTTDVSIMQESIDRAVNWTNNNSVMKINSNKSKEMVICFTPDDNFRNSIPSIVIYGNIVETVEYAKLLGVTLSNDFDLEQAR